MKKTYKVKLKISDKGILDAFKRMSGVYRATYNLGISAQLYNENLCCCNSDYSQHWLSGTTLYKVLQKSKYPFMKQVDNGIFEAGVFASSKAFLSAFKLKIPKFYSRKKTGLKFKTYGNVKVFYDYITIPKLGKVSLCEKGRIPQGMKYSNVTFSNDGKDWYISLEVSEIAPKVDLTGQALTADISPDGNLFLNGASIENVVNSESYSRLEKKLKRLKKKLIRQAKSNNHYNTHGKKITEITKNSIKTKNKITLVKNRLENKRKDSFRKIANEVAKTKPTELHVLSKGAVREYRQGYLTRTSRRSDCMHLYNVLTRKIALLGTKITEHQSPLALRSTLGSRAKRLWSLEQVPRGVQKLKTMKQEPLYGEQKKTKTRKLETLISNHE